jgi:hypothetical protein
MRNLWPKTLEANKPQFREILLSQAQFLTDLTSGALRAELKETILDNVLVISFLIYVDSDSGSSFELFRLRAPAGQYPLVVAPFDAASDVKLTKINSDTELESVLSSLFQTEYTQRIIATLTEIAGSRQNYVNQGELPIWITSLTDAGLNDFYANATVRGMATTIDVSELQKLLSAPGTPDSAYQPFGDGLFVGVISVRTPIRMTLTAGEVENIREMVRNLLSGSKIPPLEALAKKKNEKRPKNRPAARK